MKPATIKMQVSSGGVIFRKTDKNDVEIALVAVKGGTVWTLPKGLVEKYEKPEETAVREVKEETGLSGKLLKKIGDTSYWYYIKDDNAKCRKTVHFYLLEYTGGSTEDHNWEVDNAEWFSLDEALRKLSYRGDRDIVQKAKEMLVGQNT
ncbi:MAG: NUDIX hydrolase [Thermodesulfovibrionales bacterium]